MISNQTKPTRGREVAWYSGNTKNGFPTRTILSGLGPEYPGSKFGGHAFAT